MAGDVKAPEVCPRGCEDGWIVGRDSWPQSGWFPKFYCDACRCQICNARTDVIGGECGACADEADRYESRKEASR